MKPTFTQLLHKHHVKLTELAKVSQVNIMHISAMYLNHPVEKQVATRVIAGLNKMCYTHYTLNGIKLSLQKER